MTVEMSREGLQVNTTEWKKRQGTGVGRKILFLAKDLGDERQRGLKLQVFLRAPKTHLTEIGF